MDAATIIGNVISQSGTDASRATVLSLLNEAYMQQVADARWLQESVAVGTTVAGQATYAVPTSPEIVEVTGLKVGSYPWTRQGEQEMWENTALGGGNWTGRYGSYAPSYDSAGVLSITLWPTPDSSGTAITAKAAVLPTALTDSGGSVPITPTDSHGSLIDGASAFVLMRVDERPDLAAPFMQRFNDWTEKLRRRKNSMLRGRGPVQVQVQGYHFAG